ncbi:hypothetical protein Y032_0033g2769 [Ancylostoma ceylanicum]|uniref:Uncharacterized protein n=1 Tax=Ancylostoma ceylanicum TaxID=53326 RepID=A0A016UQ87_9BILA|nr:hypothetical protein Y032_0033g2769 [Ancylostoma ceylanicum]
MPSFISEYTASSRRCIDRDSDSVGIGARSAVGHTVDPRSTRCLRKKQAVKQKENSGVIGDQLSGRPRRVTQCQWSRCHSKCTVEKNRLYPLYGQILKFQ